MGRRSETECLDCGHVFMCTFGGGMFYERYYCECCDQAKNFDTLKFGDLKKAMAANDNLEFKCQCGGMFTPDALPKCPKCWSSNLKEGRVFVRLD